MEIKQTGRATNEYYLFLYFLQQSKQSGETVMEPWVVILVIAATVALIIAVVFATKISKLRKTKKYERGLKMVPL